jgi:hypothetical protein
MSIANILTSLLTAFIASVLTAVFAFWRFRSERWWEKKFAAYEAIFEALHDMTTGFDYELEIIEQGGTVSEDEMREHAEQFLVGKTKIRKQIDVGEFLLPKTAIDALWKLMKELDKAQRGTSYHDYIDEMCLALTRSLGEIRQIAKSDLRSGPMRLSI